MFRSFNTVGLLYNTESIHIGAQSVNGFSKKGTFIGLGAGIDWYGISSLPIFLDLRQQIKWGKNTFFVYGDLGYNIAWIDGDGGNQGLSSEYDNDGGLYYDFGAGYLIPFNGKNAMVLSLGYSVKEMKEWYGFSYCSWTGQCPSTSYEQFDYRFKRLSVKAGWRF